MDLHCAKCASTICEYGRLGLEEASTAVAMAVTGGWLSCINFFVFPQGQAQMGAAAAALPTPTLPLGLPTTMPVATATSTAVKGAASSGLSPSANLPDLVNLPPLPPIDPALLSCLNRCVSCCRRSGRPDQGYNYIPGNPTLYPNPVVYF